MQFPKVHAQVDLPGLEVPGQRRVRHPSEELAMWVLACPVYILRGPYKRNEYRKVILPLTVLRRFECLLEPTRQAALEEFQSLKTKPERVQQARLQQITGHRFYNLSRMQFTLPDEKVHSLLDDLNNLAPNLNSYINGFSRNVRAIMEKFKFGEQIAHMAESL